MHTIYCSIEPDNTQNMAKQKIESPKLYFKKSLTYTCMCKIKITGGFFFFFLHAFVLFIFRIKTTEQDEYIQSMH